MSIKLSDLIAPEFKEYLFDIDTTWQVLMGGRNGTKSTVNGLKFALLMIQHQFIDIVVVRENYNTLKGSAFRDIIKGFEMLGIELKVGINYPKGNSLWIKYGTNVVQFGSMNDWEKLKGLRPSSPTNSIVALYLVELDQFTKAKYAIDQTFSTFSRGHKPFFFVVGEFNGHPMRTHWSWEWWNGLKLRDDANCIKFNYNDLSEQKQKEWLGDKLLKEIELLSQIDYQQYKSIYLGQPANLEGRVYNNFDPEKNIHKVNEYTKDRWYYIGVDYGDKDSTTFYLESFAKDMSNHRVHKEKYLDGGDRDILNQADEFALFAKECHDLVDGEWITAYFDNASNTIGFHKICKSREPLWLDCKRVNKNKSNEIERRISVENLMFGSGYTSIHESCKFLLKAIDLAEYDKRNKRKDCTKTLFTDAIDGWEYGFIHKLVQIRRTILEQEVI